MNGSRMRDRGKPQPRLPKTGFHRLPEIGVEWDGWPWVRPFYQMRKTTQDINAFRSREE